MRLDELLLARYPEHNIKALQSFVLQGKVIVNGNKVTKVGEKFSSDTKGTKRKEIDIGMRILEYILLGFG